MGFQAIYDIAELCARKGLQHAVLCPGSRCAPLTLAFARHSGITTKTFSDERSAAFVALGIAQQTKTAAILLSTSGTAAYNFAPAIAEAFFSETPLIVFTADRPAEWIAQHDGQTIYQSQIYGKHVKKSFDLPQEYDHPDSQWAVNRIVNDAVNLALAKPCGPVHINAPFREPLYPKHDDVFGYSKDVRSIEATTPEIGVRHPDEANMREELSRYHNILVVAGQLAHDEALIGTLHTFMNTHNIPVVGDVITNLHPLEHVVSHSDVFLAHASKDIKKSLQPDLLITFGKSVIAKNLKLFLRQHPPAAHWHVQPSGEATDTFQNLTRVVSAEPTLFFDFLSQVSPPQTFENQKQSNYNKLWEIEERRASRSLNEFFPQDEMGELEVVREVLNNLPDNCNLHLANSMSVRYANFIGLAAAARNIKVYANRGTSGIDGCTSTAVGHNLVSERLDVLITGDMAFFYDRNAFWHNYELPRFRVLVLNNHGGIIFGMIDGPASLPEADEYFITRQSLTAKKLCEEFGFDYLRLDNRRKLKNTIKDFFDPEKKTKILEIETTTAVNKTIFNNLKQKIKKSYEV